MVRTHDGAPSTQMWAGVVLVGTAGLLYPSIINGFPLIFPDSSDYIMLTPRLYRSPFYQLWVFITGWKISPWPTIVAQAMLVSWLITVFIRLETHAKAWSSMASLIALCVFTSLPIVTTFVMPDVFTGIMFLSVFLLVFHWKKLTNLQRFGIFTITTIAISAHLSHLVMGVAISAVSVLLLALRDGRDFDRFGAIAALAACAIAAVSILSYNTVVFHRSQLSPAGSTFLMANMIAKGPARAELYATCPAARYRLCGHLSELSESADYMLWENGLIVRLGGFPAMVDESRRLVSATVMHRPGAVLVTSLTSTAAALLTLNPTAEVEPVETYVHQRLSMVYGRRAEATFLQTAQERQAFPHLPIDMLTACGLVTAILVILAFAWVRRGKGMTFSCYVGIAFIGNALVCATLSGVHDRYQSRISWLIMLAAISLVLSYSRQVNSSFHQPGEAAA